MPFPRTQFVSNTMVIVHTVNMRWYKLFKIFLTWRVCERIADIAIGRLLSEAVLDRSSISNSSGGWLSACFHNQRYDTILLMRWHQNFGILQLHDIGKGIYNKKQRTCRDMIWYAKHKAKYAGTRHKGSGKANIWLPSHFRIKETTVKIAAARSINS